jgi:hypothetical protein
MVVVRRKGKYLSRSASNHRRKDFHLIEHSQKSVKQTIEGKKGIRQGNPTNH